MCDCFAASTRSISISLWGTGTSNLVYSSPWRVNRREGHTAEGEVGETRKTHITCRVNVPTIEKDVYCDQNVIIKEFPNRLVARCAGACECVCV